MSIRVLIADDHPLVRDGLRFSIARSGKDIAVVREAANGLDVLAMAEQEPVDVFIIDITMPGLNGLDVTRALIQRSASAKAIILSLHDTRSVVEEAMAVGARGYLTKETASQHVADAVSEVYAGHVYLSPDITHYFVPLKRPRIRRIATLTPQERAVLRLIAEGQTTKDIARALQRAVNTIQSHRKNLMAKLNVHKQTDLVRVAVKEGLVKP